MSLISKGEIFFNVQPSPLSTISEKTLLDVCRSRLPDMSMVMIFNRLKLVKFKCSLYKQS